LGPEQLDLTAEGERIAVSIETLGFCPIEGQTDHPGLTSATTSLAANRGLATVEECPAQFPSNLLSVAFTERGRNGAFECAWWLAHTRPQQERAVAAALVARRVPYYIPLVTRKTLVRSRTRVARIPLFPGYVFVRGSDDDRLQVLQTNRVLTVRHVPDGNQLQSDLSRFSELIALDVPLIRESRLEAGERVRVKAGPFRDNEGVVIRRNGKTRLLVAINYLQQGASLEIDDCLLEPL
jgi:transcription antitermination factor NusG